MNNLYLKLITLIIIMINVIPYNNNEYIGRVYDDLDDRIKMTICEYRIQGSYNISNTAKSDVKEQVEAIKDNILVYLGQVSVSDDGEYNYKLSFPDIDYKGGIEIAPYKDTIRIITYVDLRGEELDLSLIKRLKDDFTKALNGVSTNVEYSLSLKSKILDDTMEETEEKVIKQLDEYRAENTKVGKINNGYSIISNTGMNRSYRVCGEDIDFNCAIVRYSSGCYLILGTPEIVITY